MRQRAVRCAVVLAVLGAPLAVAIPHGSLAAKPGPVRAVALQAPGAAIALKRLEHAAPRVHVAARHAVQRVAPAQRPAVQVTQLTRPTTQVVSRRTTPRSTRALAHDLILTWPAHGVITTPFIPDGPLRHDGIDIGSLRSLTVTAAHDGTVIHVGYTTGFEGYGQIVDVEVAPGIETLYAHLAAMAVQIGQVVHTGEVLGTAGCTGICTGTHLHFEVRVNGTPVNPVPLLHGG